MRRKKLLLILLIIEVVFCMSGCSVRNKSIELSIGEDLVLEIGTDTLSDIIEAGYELVTDKGEIEDLSLEMRTFSTDNIEVQLNEKKLFLVSVLNDKSSTQELPKCKVYYFSVNFNEDNCNLIKVNEEKVYNITIEALDEIYVNCEKYRKRFMTADGDVYKIEYALKYGNIEYYLENGRVTGFTVTTSTYEE